MNRSNKSLNNVLLRNPWTIWILLFTSLLVGCNPDQERAANQNDPLSISNQTPSSTGNEETSSVIQTDYALRHATYYTGSCDGSGAVAISKDHFAVVNDETSQLLIYTRNAPGAPIQKTKLHKALDLKKGEEADLEGLARIGNRIYVLGSHSRDRDGKKQKERRKLLAIHFQAEEDEFKLKPIGKAYEDLMDDLTDHSAFKSLDLKVSTKRSGDDPDGFNIEGLCAGQNGSLWLCFRGPRVDGKALLIPLNNPEDVTAGAKARFGDHVLLDLQGRTIRGADNSQENIVIIADDDFNGRSPVIYLWEESQTTVTSLSIPDLDTFDPESIIIYPDTGLQELQILSDDGGRRLGSKDCKDEKDTDLKRFRSATYSWRNR